jgi:type II secretory pathway component GspD/PulD (secretin)/tetratricopeptide (TPR) repeat protein
VFQAKLNGLKRLAAGLVLLPGLTAVGAEVLHALGTAQAQQRPAMSNSFGEAAPLAPTPEDARALLKRAREAMDNNRFEIAYELARQAEVNGRNVKWGLFDDTPESVLKAVVKARTRRDQQKAGRMVGQARELLDKRTGTAEQRALNLDKARTLCVEAMRLHGPYSVWDLDFGDRPDALLREIDTIRAQVPVPPQAADPRAVDMAGTQQRQAPKYDYYTAPPAPAPKDTVSTPFPKRPDTGFYEPPPGWGNPAPRKPAATTDQGVSVAANSSTPVKPGPYNPSTVPNFSTPRPSSPDGFALEGGAVVSKPLQPSGPSITGEAPLPGPIPQPPVDTQPPEPSPKGPDVGLPPVPPITVGPIVTAPDQTPVPPVPSYPIANTPDLRPPVPNAPDLPPPLPINPIAKAPEPDTPPMPTPRDIVEAPEPTPKLVMPTLTDPAPFPPPKKEEPIAVDLAPPVLEPVVVQVPPLDDPPLIVTTTPPEPVIPMPVEPVVPEPTLHNDTPGFVPPVTAVAVAKAPADPGLDLSPPPETSKQKLVPEPTVPVPSPNKVKENQDRIRAVELMQQASASLKGERYVEARQALIEAQNLNAPFGADEETPEQQIQSLMASAQKRINDLGRDAHQRMLRKTAEDFAAAERMLNDADAIAKGLGLSNWATDMHRTQLHAMMKAVGVPVATGEAMPAPPLGIPAAGAKPGDPGFELLRQAESELRANQLENAHNIAIQVLSMNSVYKDQAAALIRTIDSEQVRQKEHSNRQAYERGVEALQSRNFDQALSIFKLIDESKLPASKRKLLHEQMDLAAKHLDKAEPVVTVAAAPPRPAEPVSPEKFGADSLVKQAEAMRELQFQKLRAEGLQTEASATARFGKGETDAAMQDLSAFVARVNDADIDPTKKTLLTRPVETRLERLKVLKHQQDYLTKEAKTLKDFRSQMTQDQLYKANRKEHVAQLMKEYVKLMDAGKFQEANKVAMEARTLDPDDPATMAALTISKMAYRDDKWKKTKEAQENWNWEEGNNAFEFGPAVGGKDPLKIDPESFERTRRRQDVSRGYPGTMRSMSDKEKMIEAKLNSFTVNLHFKNVPLEDVVTHLQSYTGLNFYLDTRALSAEPRAKDPITVDLNQITLKSALELVLKTGNLKYLIDNEVICITTQKGARGKLVQRVIPVADLVIPVQNYATPAVSNLDEALANTMRGNQPFSSGMGSMTPHMSNSGMSGSGMPTGSPSLGGPGARPGSLINNSGGAGMQITKESASGTIEESLIRLITGSVQPDTWEAMGGAGRVEYYPLGMALVINQTPDVIEEVGRLLEALRRLQDLEVAIEVRMITLAETFYERIGLDFSMNVSTHNKEVSANLANSSASNSNLTNAQNLGARLIGLATPGVPTYDLNVPISSSSFGMSIPPFGNYPNAPGLDGGLSLGLAFLSDIQVQMFLDAAQGDSRSNVMQAPKLTMFNGQSASLKVQDQQFFLTGITVTSVNGQLVFSPQNNPFPLGVTMNLQPVVSGDRRFVRLNIQQMMTNLASATVPLFPITTIITPIFDTGAQGQPVPFTQYIQQPTFTTINVSTTVVVPDGGTVLLGGMKTLNEGRNEFGPPILSKIPYIDRLFRNVGYGRDVQSLMMMVTPRIIINREEQERQTGVIEGGEEQ